MSWTKNKERGGQMPACPRDAVVKGTNFSAPKHGGVTYLTLGELKAIAAHWKVDMKLD